MSERLRVVAEAQADGHADGERDDVLDRAAQLAADDVVVGVRAEVPGLQRPAPARRRPIVGAGDDAGRRLPGGDLLARLGPVTTATRSGATPATSLMTSLIRLVVPSSMPFIRLTRMASARSAAPVARGCPAGLRRDGEHDEVGAVERLGRVARSRAARGGSAMPGR